jgi:hypothetical protein
MQNFGNSIVFFKFLIAMGQLKHRQTLSTLAMNGQKGVVALLHRCIVQNFTLSFKLKSMHKNLLNQSIAERASPGVLNKYVTLQKNNFHIQVLVIFTVLQPHP